MGAPDLPGQSLLRSERKLVTVLVCQVDVPTASGQDDPEDVRRLLVGSLARVQAEVARHGGLVPEGIGDTVVAVFGVPRTRDDDAERAVQAALAIRAALLGAGGQLRAGVGTGQALVGGDDPAGGQRRRVTGEVVAAAIAAKDAAPPGAVLVTGATLQATQRAVSYAPARELRLPGTTAPVAVWEALAPRPRSGRAPPPVLGAELLGRDGERAVLLDRYQQARTGGGPQLVTLVGPAGIGKSRLLAELGQHVAGEVDPPRWRGGRAQPRLDGGAFGRWWSWPKPRRGSWTATRPPPPSASSSTPSPR